MKYILKSRQDSSYLKKADYIKVEYRDRNEIPDLAKRYPQAKIILQFPYLSQPDVDEIKKFYVLSRKNLIVCLSDIENAIIEELRAEQIPFFWAYSIRSAYELNALKRLGICAARVDAPLFFQADVLKQEDIDIFVTANLANDGYLPYGDGVNGCWIKPEDVDQYEGIIDAIGFFSENKEQEQAFYRIYAEKHGWPGEVTAIIKAIETKAVNRMIPPEFTEHRLNCGQRCESKHNCKLCWQYLSLADPDKIKKALEQKE